MGFTVRAAQAIGGPSGGTMWVDAGDAFSVAGAPTATSGPGVFTASTTTPGLLVAQIVTRPNPFYSTSLNYANATQDILNSTNVIQNFYGFQIAAPTVLAAKSNLTITFSVYRTVGQLSGAGGTGTVSVPLKANLTQTIPSGATLTITKVDGSASTSLTTSGVAAPGTASIPVSSVDLTGYADGSNIVYVVGGSAAFGWVGGSGGTPAFPAGCSVVAPAITTNTAVISGVGNGLLPWPAPNGVTVANVGFIPVQAGDALVMNLVTSSSTVASIPPLTIQILLL